ncbi:germ cell nuclear acidic protein-like [Lineus longissimus]|uniref:germ cell nuclear acidic protein-like n=1 Tax=Lineus longissimus TaxID=88925 RepID=UPI002B4E75DC
MQKLKILKKKKNLNKFIKKFEDDIKCCYEIFHLQSKPSNDRSDDSDKSKTACDPSDDGDKNKTASDPSDDSDKSITARDPRDDSDKSKTACDPSDDGDKCKTALDPRDDSDKSKTASDPSDDGDKSKTASDPSDDGDKRKTASDPSDDGDKSKIARDPSDDGDKSKTARDPRHDVNNLEAGEIAQDHKDDINNISNVAELAHDDVLYLPMDDVNLLLEVLNTNEEEQEQFIIGLLGTSSDDHNCSDVAGIGNNSEESKVTCSGPSDDGNNSALAPACDPDDDGNRSEDETEHDPSYEPDDSDSIVSGTTSGEESDVISCLSLSALGMKKRKRTRNQRPPTEKMCSSNNDDIFIKKVCKRQTHLVSGKEKRDERVHNKYQSCLYCEKLVAKLSSHVSNTHKGEKEVKAILALEIRKDDSKTEKERKRTARNRSFEKLRNRGNFKHNQKVLDSGKGELILVRRPVGAFRVEDYGPCCYCLGFFLKSDLGKHQTEHCHFKKGPIEGKLARFRVKSCLGSI